MDDEMKRELASIRPRFDQVDTRLNKIDTRLDRIESTMKDMYRRTMGAIAKMAEDITEIKHALTTKVSKHEIYPFLEKFAAEIDLSRREKRLVRMETRRA